MTLIHDIATLTLIMFMPKITELNYRIILDTLASCNYDKESFLLLEFLSAAFSLLMVILQTNSFLFLTISLK